MKKGKYEIKASAWPWQKGFNRHGRIGSIAPLNPTNPKTGASARFGGGWKYRLGFAIGSGEYGWTLMIDLLFGTVTIRKRNY